MLVLMFFGVCLSPKEMRHHSVLLFHRALQLGWVALSWVKEWREARGADVS